MNNISKHQIYLQMCKDYAQMSKCRKIQVGCMIVNQGRIVSTGTNGSPAGHLNCTDHFKNVNDEMFLFQHSDWSIENEVHAEMNALLYASKSNVEITSDCIMYCTHEPCNNCLKHIAVTGIRQIYYELPYYGNTQNNQYQIKITQLSLNSQDENIIKNNSLQSYRIIINAREYFINKDTITRNELIQISFNDLAIDEYANCRVIQAINNQLITFGEQTIIKCKNNMIFHVTLSIPI